MNQLEFDSVVSAFQSSRLYAAWRAVTDGFAVALSDSALLRPVRSFAAAFTRLPASRRLSASAMTIGFTALALVAIRATLPHYATSGLPWWWNVTVALFAFGVAIAADLVASAWIDSTPARIWRRLTT